MIAFGGDFFILSAHLGGAIMNREQRMLAAKERMLSRYTDRDAEEAKRMEAFRGLSQEQIKARFHAAARERGIQLDAEKKKAEMVN